MTLRQLESFGREFNRDRIYMSELTNILKVTPAMIRSLGIRPILRGSRKAEAKYTLAEVQALISKRNPSLTNFWPADSYLTPQEAADLIGVLVATLANWRCHKRGPVYVIISRRCIRYRLEDINKWLQQDDNPDSANQSEGGEEAIAVPLDSNSEESNYKKINNMTYQEFMNAFGK